MFEIKMEIYLKHDNKKPYLGLEGGRPIKPTQAVRHTCMLTPIDYQLYICLESLRNRTPSNLKLHHISINPLNIVATTS
jgi:hypothetical protein